MSKGFHRLAADTPWDNRSFGGYPLPVHKGAIASSTAEVAAPIGLVPLADFMPGPPAMTREEARGKGFTGNTCSNCGSSEMQIAGHCEVCASCGTTTGCS